MKEHTDMSNPSQTQIGPNNPFKIKSRITSISRTTDKEFKLKRAMTLTYNPDHSRVKSPSKLSP
jgi:hypothetical protein